MKLMLLTLSILGISSSLWSMNTQTPPQRLLMVRVADLMTVKPTLKKHTSIVSHVPRSTSPVEVESIVVDYTRIEHDKFTLVDVAHMSSLEKKNYFSLPGDKMRNEAAGNSPLCFIAKPNTTAIQPLNI